MENSKYFIFLGRILEGSLGWCFQLQQEHYEDGTPLFKQHEREELELHISVLESRTRELLRITWDVSQCVTSSMRTKYLTPYRAALPVGAARSDVRGLNLSL